MARDGLPTGSGTASADKDVADPHPSDEEHFDQQPVPGGVRAPRDDIGANGGKHDGTPRRPPHNRENEG